jgi:hypothetical protein
MVAGTDLGSGPVLLCVQNTTGPTPFSNLTDTFVSSHMQQQLIHYHACQHPRFLKQPASQDMNSPVVLTTHGAVVSLKQVL